jgi:membrane-bound ClpP family serine protease
VKNARLIIAIVSSLLDEAIIVAIIIFGLPRLGVHLPAWAIALVCVAFVAFAVGSFRIGSRTLRQKPLPGLTNMVGVMGRAASPLKPKGFIRIGGELWEARSEKEPIDAGTEVIVVAQLGLKLVVRRKTPVNNSIPKGGYPSA